MLNRKPGRGSPPRLALWALVIGIVVACASGVHAAERNLRFEHFFPESGLSQGSVKCLLQDDRGFLWLGTEDGLNRYDGHKFTVFRRDDRDPTSLPHSYIQSLLQDQMGDLWIGTRSGLARQIPGQSFERFRHDPDDPASLANDEVLALLETTDGSLWVGTRGGLSRFNRTEQRFETFRHEPGDAESLGADVVLALFEDRRGRLWIGTDGGGLSRWLPDLRQFLTFRHEPGVSDSLGDDRVSAIREDGGGRLWVGTLGGTLDRWVDDSSSFVRHLGPGSASAAETLAGIRALYEDEGHSLWVGTDEGLVSFRPDEAAHEFHRRDPVDVRTLSDDRVLSLLTDHSDVLWVGTTNGLNKTSLRSSHFRVVRAGSGPADLTNGVVTAIYDGDGGTWIGTFGGGLGFLDNDTRAFTRYVHDSADPYSLSGDRVMSVLVSSDGTVWAGTFRGGLNRLDPGTERFRRYVHDPADPRSLATDGITALLEDSEGRLWIAAFNGGIHLYAPESDDFIRYQHDPTDPTSLADPRVLAMFEDREGSIWLGTATAGIARLDPGTGKFESYRPDLESPESLSAAAVYSFSEDAAGNLWIGTQGGLHRWDVGDRESNRARFTRYTESDGLPNNVVYGILPDDAGSLWLSTNHGLSRFDLSTHSFSNYDISHGLQGREFNLGAYHRARNGELFFGGTSGLNRFDPRQIRANDHLPPVVITSIRKLNDPLQLDVPVWDIGEVEVDHNDYVISFEFAALDFVDPERNRYAYMLEGLDEDWIQLGNDRRATYTNLAAGRYTLRVRASNNDGVWNEKGTNLDLVVYPPPWKTWWAYTLYALSLLLLIGAYVRAQYRKLLREEEYSRRLEAEVDLRTNQLAHSNSALQEANLRLESAAFTDPLTGLYNRRFLMNQVEAEIARLEREYCDDPSGRAASLASKRDMAFVVIDLDGLKQVNDTHGHDAGDQTIRQTAELLRSCSRGSDSLIRLGGDEFLMVARGVTIDGAQVLASRICNRVREHEFDLGNGITRRMSCSVGYSFFPFLADNPTLLRSHEVIAIADRALYFTKTYGRNAFAGIRPNDSTPAEGLFTSILEDLDRMLEQKLVELDTSLKVEMPVGF